MRTIRLNSFRFPATLRVLKAHSSPVISRIENISRHHMSSMSDSVHFRASNTKHSPVASSGTLQPGDHLGLQQNHIWREEELLEKLSTLYHHKPQTTSDHIMRNAMYGVYHIFNFITRYKIINPDVNAIEWRLIVLHSVSSVPAFVAAAFRHFRSLRTLERDHGWIPTLLEEAENGRMHVLICLNMFNASKLTRMLVVAAQTVMAPLLASIYFLSPSAMHRFVGYFAETACKTYVNVIDHIETPGTKLNIAWANAPAPEIARGYYRLPENAKWVDALKCMMADETHHRDVNHTFADMKSDDPNPFITMHKEDAMIAWRLNDAGESAWSTAVSPAKGAAGGALLSAGLKPCQVASARRKKDCKGDCPECMTTISFKLPSPQ